MGTRSMVFYEKEDGTLKGSYFHFDGYVEFTGVMLLKFYDSSDKVKALVDFSPSNSGIEESIEKMIEEKVAYKDASVHYHFDSIESLSMALKKGEYSLIEFVYIFTNKGAWEFAIPERIDAKHYAVFFKGLKEYCAGEGINYND